MLQYLQVRPGDVVWCARSVRGRVGPDRFVQPGRLLAERRAPSGDAWLDLIQPAAAGLSEHGVLRVRIRSLYVTRDFQDGADKCERSHRVVRQISSANKQSQHKTDTGG